MAALLLAEVGTKATTAVGCIADMGARTMVVVVYNGAEILKQWWL